MSAETINWRELLREEADIVLAPFSLRGPWGVVMFLHLLLARDDAGLTNRERERVLAKLDETLSRAGEVHPYFARRWIREEAATAANDQPKITALRTMWRAIPSAFEGAPV